MGIAVLIVAGIMLQRPLRERYWLWKLESETEDQTSEAAERLGQTGSVKAIPSLINALAELHQIGDFWWVKSDTSELILVVSFDVPGRENPRQGPLAYFAAIQGISSRMPERTEKLLRSYLSDDREIARAVAASVLFKGTSGAQKYVSPLRNSLSFYTSLGSPF